MNFVRKFLFSTFQFIIIVDVAIVTLSFCVRYPFSSMFAVSGEFLSSVLVIAEVTHAQSVDWKIDVLAFSYLTFFPTGLSCLLSTWLWTGIGNRANFRVRLAQAVRDSSASLEVHLNVDTALFLAVLRIWTVLNFIRADATLLAWLNVLTGFDTALLHTDFRCRTCIIRANTASWT